MKGSTGSVLIIALSLAAAALAAPTMRLGGRLSGSADHIYASTYDSLGEVLRTTYKDPYLGPGLEAVYGPVGWLYGRIDLAELQFFRAGGGALVLFPHAGLDVLVEPPVRWRLLPYLWGGMRYAGYWGSQGTPDPRFNELYVLTPLYELRAGLGLRYRLSSRLYLFAETQVLSDFTVFSYLPFRDAPRGYQFTGIGFLRPALGVRYDFGGR
uniref:Outer membrane protein beta-barrel domain-containing protein n=1 Tax=candidate division WOR-3 bacterium TaxID=2052148 RepID=A0A7C4CAQ0_UNCW3